MQNLAGLSDVEAALGGELEPDEHRAVEVLLGEATALVRAYAPLIDRLPETPDEVRLVVARMVARGLDAGGNPAPVGMRQFATNAGVFGLSGSFTDGATDGGVWLSKADKMILRRWRGGAFTIRTW